MLFGRSPDRTTTLLGLPRAHGQDRKRCRGTQKIAELAVTSDDQQQCASRACPATEGTAPREFLRR
jgi:hypothetical protein